MILEIEKTIGKKLEEISLDDEEVIKELVYVSNASKEVKLVLFWLCRKSLKVGLKKILRRKKKGTSAVKIVKLKQLLKIKYNL